MLKDRTLQVKLIREPALTRATAAQYQATQKPPVWTPEVISAMIQDQIQGILFTAGMVYVVKVTVDTLSEVILKKTKSKDPRYIHSV